MNMTSLLMTAAAISGLLAIACEIQAERRGRRPALFLLLKPLTTLLIASSVLTADRPPEPWLLLAFAFAAAGDIALMFEGLRAFLLGLGSFFVAHLGFVVVFGQDIGWQQVPAWSLGFVIYAIAFFSWLLPKTGALRWPTLAYGLVLTVMVLAAAAAFDVAPGQATQLALAGALLFAVSDSVLAVRQFAGPYRGAQPLILSTYWLSMGLIAASQW